MDLPCIEESENQLSIKVGVDTTELDAALEKLERMVGLLERARELLPVTQCSNE
jgi:hypothetical protein|nr:MAG TPA: hypothetical protein [Bacteriophage sp.]